MVAKQLAIWKKNPLWLILFYMATYLYYEKVHRTMYTATVSYLLKISKEAFLGALAKLKHQTKQLHL